MATQSPYNGRNLTRDLILIGIILIALIGMGLAPLISHDADYISRFQQRVNAELAAGTSEADVNAWLRTYGKYLPSRHTPPVVDLVQGRNIIDWAKMPRDQVASLLRVTVPREDMVSKFKTDYVRVYFFFDQQGKLIGNYFLKWSDIVRIEANAS